jgi:hypothetical protein
MELLERPNKYELLHGVGYLNRKCTSIPTKLKLSNKLDAGHGSRLRHALSSLARKPGSGVRIPLRAWIFSICVCVCVRY